MYRAIKTINGSEHIEFKHFNTVRDSYVWLVPTLQVQGQEGWHLKLLWLVVQELDNINSPHYVHVGNNILNHETSLYIQKVNQQDDTLPSI